MNTKLCLAVAAANKDLAHDVLLDLLTTNCAVLLRVKCFGIACKVFFQTLAECDAEIGGVVHLAHTAGNALTDGIIRDTGGAMQPASLWKPSWARSAARKMIWTAAMAMATPFLPKLLSS